MREGSGGERGQHLGALEEQDLDGGAGGGVDGLGLVGGLLEVVGLDQIVDGVVEAFEGRALLEGEGTSGEAKGAALPAVCSAGAGGAGRRSRPSRASGEARRGSSWRWQGGQEAGWQLIASQSAQGVGEQMQRHAGGRSIARMRSIAGAR